MAAEGVFHVGKVTHSCNCIFNQIHQENDIGNDAFIEFIVSEALLAPIFAQIKSGTSYVHDGRFIFPPMGNSCDQATIKRMITKALPKRIITLLTKEGIPIEKEAITQATQDWQALRLSQA